MSSLAFGVGDGAGADDDVGFGVILIAEKHDELQINYHKLIYYQIASILSVFALFNAQRIISKSMTNFHIPKFTILCAWMHSV